MKSLVVSALAIALLGIASLALAAEVSRSEYKAQVEPICRTNSKANDRILKPVRSLVRRERLRPASRRFLRASRALKRAFRELTAVPQPTADEARLTRWLTYVKKEADLLSKAGKALKAGNRHRAQRFVNQLNSNAKQANARVLAFGFHFCKFEPAKYT
jgi:hypothetical protein